MANEERLIYATELIDEINEAISNIAFTSPYQNDIATVISGMERVLDIVEDAQTADAVEVVRCKNCQHRGDDVCCPMCFEEAIEWDNNGYTEVDYVLYDRTTDDGFCDRGERTEGE